MICVINVIVIINFIDCLSLFLGKRWCNNGSVRLLLYVLSVFEIILIDNSKKNS